MHVATTYMRMSNCACMRAWGDVWNMSGEHRVMGASTPHHQSVDRGPGRALRPPSPPRLVSRPNLFSETPSPDYPHACSLTL